MYTMEITAGSGPQSLESRLPPDTSLASYLYHSSEELLKNYVTCSNISGGCRIR